MIGPDFFIVGAPKCGTTSLDAYLSEHPEIFMARKEPHFFGSDLDEVFRHPAALRGRPSADEYFGLFAGSEWAVRRGEASVWYLWSRCAAEEIHHYRPESRIIVLLRNPLDMLASLHSQYVYNAVEDLEDFAEALAAETDRRNGLRIPPHHGPHPWRLFYREIARFHDQVQRYLSVFGHDQVHVVLYDDLRRDPLSTYRRVVEFLDVDQTFVPTFRVVNANKQVRSRRLQRTVWTISDESSLIRRVGSHVIPVHRLRSAILREALPKLKNINTAVTERPQLDAGLRARLASELATDIERLGHLIGRDLGHWHASGTIPAAPGSASGQPSSLRSH